MNIFYAPPSQIQGENIELLGQEAQHAAKVLRYEEGDAINVVDGKGGWYHGHILQIKKDSILSKIDKQIQKKQKEPELVLALGIIKKRDRLEFAIEKAVELGASEVVLFRSKRTIKQNVRMDRLMSTALSAMKQSLRTYLPEIKILPNLQEVAAQYPEYNLLVAHEKKEGKAGVSSQFKSLSKLVLMVGPEGGFTEEEIAMLEKKKAQVISLGIHRLRAETAVIAFLSQFI